MGGRTDEISQALMSQKKHFLKSPIMDLNKWKKQGALAGEGFHAKAFDAGQMSNAGLTMGKSLSQKIVSGIGGALSVAAAAKFGWDIGKAIDQAFDISGKVARLVSKNFKAGADKEADLRKKYGNKFFTRELGSTLKSKGKTIDDYNNMWGGDQVKILKELEERIKSGQVENIDVLGVGLKEANGEAVSLNETLENITIENQKIFQEQQEWIGQYTAAASAATDLVNIGKDIGVANVTAAKEAAMYHKQASEAAKVSFETQVKAASELAKSMGKSFETKGGNPQEQSKSALEQMQKIYTDLMNSGDKSVEAEERKKQILLIQKGLLETSVTMQKQNAEYIMKNIDAANAQLNVQNKINDAYESRINAERELQESAMFGMGASVEMMQKQVDLAYQRIEDTQTAIDLNRKLAQEQYGLTEEEVRGLENAKDKNEMQKMAVNLAEKHNVEAGALISHAENYQKKTAETMKYQKQIYELTKEVREGYLSAMRSMASGFGKFSKIIGTQSRGVTQLMKLVKDTQGINALNTMALGGYQTREQTQAGVGTEVTMRYGAGGIEDTLSGKEKRARQQRIYKYGEQSSNSGKIGTAVGASTGDIAAMKATGRAFTISHSRLPTDTNEYGVERRTGKTRGQINAEMKAQRDVSVPGYAGGIPAVTQSAQLANSSTSYSSYARSLGFTIDDTMPSDGGPALPPSSRNLTENQGVQTKLEDINQQLININQAIRGGIHINSMSPGT